MAALDSSSGCGETGEQRQRGLRALPVPEAGQAEGEQGCGFLCCRPGRNVRALQWDRVQLFVVPCGRKEPGRNCDWVTRSSWSASWGGAATGSPVQDWAWRLPRADCKYFAEVLFSGNYFNMNQCFLFCLILLWAFLPDPSPTVMGAGQVFPQHMFPAVSGLSGSVAVSRCYSGQPTSDVSFWKNGWSWTCEAFETTKLFQ